MRGQGATEYLVLLAVVLIVALVSVALLGFFPGMASDAQMTQSKAYWQSASPISIIEMDAIGRTSDASSNLIYLRLKNSGPYAIRITKISGGGKAISSIFQAGGVYPNISDTYYLAPGEESYVGGTNYGYSSLPANRVVEIMASGGGIYDIIAQSMCSSTASGGSFGYLTLNNFGFEYIEYIEGQQVTKKEGLAKPLVIKCSAAQSV